MKKTNFFYVDESGHINNDSSIFIFGCMKTDTPRMLEETLENLKNELSEDALLREFGEKVKQNNFHATGDQQDVRTAMFRLLPYLNFRCYLTIMFKSNKVYSNLYYQKKKAELKDYEIIESMLRKLIIPRITKSKNAINTFYFENLEVQGKSLSRILSDIFSPYKEMYDVEYFIVDKENPNIPIIDYINFIFNLSSIINNMTVNNLT